MGKLVLAVAGAAIGSTIGQPQLGWGIGSFLGGMLFPDSPQKITQTQPLMDLRITGTEYGQCIPYVQGAAGIAGQIWWNTDRRPHYTTTTSGGGGGGKGGGGGGGPVTETTTISYDMDLMIGVSDNPIVGIARIWNNGELIWTSSSGAAAGSIAASAASNAWTRMTVYTGHEDQLPDPTYEAAVGIGNAPAYRGRGSVFIEGFQLGQGGAVPNLVFEVVVSGSIGHVGNAWTEQTSSNSAQFHGIAWSPELRKFVAVGSGTNAAMDSTDGITWTQRLLSVNGFGGLSVAWSPALGIFCAVGNVVNLTGSVSVFSCTSADGITWIERLKSTSSVISTMRGIAWSPTLSLFVGVGINGGGGGLSVIYTSPDGITWTNRAYNTTTTLRCVVWSPELGIFLASGAVTATSTDGVNWTTRTLAEANAISGAAWSPSLSLFVIVSEDGTNRVQTSPDGITWTARSASTLAIWRGVVWSPEFAQFMAVGDGVSTMVSEDGITWTAVTAAINKTHRGVAWSPTLLIYAAVVSDSGTFNRVETIGDASVDAWMARTSAADNQWRAIAWSPTLAMFAATSNTGTGNRVMTSADGINWTIRVSGADNEWVGIVWADSLNLFVAVALSSSNVMTSSDGINWTNQATGSATSFAAIAWSRELGLLVAAGGSGTTGIMTSTNGTTWTDRVTPSGFTGKAIAWSSDLGLFCAVSNNAPKVITSPDGITWTARTPAGSATLWQGIAWSSSLQLFASVSGDGGTVTNQVMTSPDGITWTGRNGSVVTAWRAITWSPEFAQFIAVGNSGSTMVSSDGITWSTRAAARNNNWSAIAWSQTLQTFAAVAESGAGDRTMTFQADNFPRVTSTAPAVSTVVRNLMLRAGLLTTQFDVTGLYTISRPMRSLALSQITATRSSLELLASTYFFEMVVSDKLYFRPRGGSSVATIPYDDLGATFDAGDAEPLNLTKSSDIEVPALISLTYINVDNDYQNDTQNSDRLISSADGTVNAVQMAIGMTPGEAKGVADTMLLDQAASVVNTSIGVLGDYCRLEPTDVVTLTGHDGSTFRMRLVKKTDNYPLLTFDAVLDDASVLTSQGITSVSYDNSTSVAPAPAVIMNLMDVPILQDADDGAGLYVATKGNSATFPGAAVYSSANGVDYLSKAIIPESAVMGNCLTVLGTFTLGRVFDESNTVNVSVGNGILSSTTRDSVLGSRTINAMLLGREIIQFATATLVSAGVYTLSRLLRGGRGTEWAVGTHIAGEPCVLLQTTGLRRIVMSNSEIGVTMYYKGVTIGRPLSTASARLFTNTSVGQKPFSPFSLRASRDGSGNITFTWQRRTRLAVRAIGTAGVSVPLGEDSEAYDIEIYSSSAYTTLKRTLTSTSATVAYSSALQVVDFGTNQAIVYARVYQRSAQVGLGYPLQQAA